MLLAPGREIEIRAAGGPKMRRTLLVMALCAPLCFSANVPCALADTNSVVFYRIGEDAPQSWAFVKQYFEGKGFPVSFYQGESLLEKHIEKVNVINRSPGKIFLAVQLAKGDKARVTVAMTDAKKKEGRFLTIEEIPGLFAEESQRLTRDIGAPFNAKVEHLPLFPLLGVNMPGAFVRIEYKEGEMEDAVRKLCDGVERYFTERMAK